jgi:uncharacterized membrane protein YidH (DUF202 family)
VSDRSFAGPRTFLAWRRTALTAAGFAALALRLGLIQRRPWDVAVAIAAALLATAAFLRGRRSSEHAVAQQSIALLAAFAIATAIVTVVALLA